MKIFGREIERVREEPLLMCLIPLAVALVACIVGSWNPYPMNRELMGCCTMACLFGGFCGAMMIPIVFRMRKEGVNHGEKQPTTRPPLSRPLSFTYEEERILKTGGMVRLCQHEFQKEAVKRSIAFFAIGSFTIVLSPDIGIISTWISFPVGLLCTLIAGLLMNSVSKYHFYYYKGQTKVENDIQSINIIEVTEDEFYQYIRSLDRLKLSQIEPVIA